jgi:hypothetical protein
MNTGMKAGMEKPPKSHPEPSRTTRPQHISPDFYVPGYTITDSNSSREKPPVNTQPPKSQSYMRRNLLSFS